jgi:hypothetical protein
MTNREILLTMAENLPPNATPLDVINELELHFAAQHKLARVLPEERESSAPAWIYESSPRLLTIIQQTRRRGAAALS